MICGRRVTPCLLATPWLCNQASRMMDETPTITIEKLVHEGFGMGSLNGKPLFVPYVLPGEKVKIKIVRRHRQYFHADLVEVIEPAPERVAPPCPYFGKCGGCQWQHMTYETQLHWKQKILEETLIRVGKITAPKVLPTIPSPRPWGWRSRVTVHADEKGNIGFFAPGTHQVVDVEKCLIGDEEINAKLQKLRAESRKVKADYELRSGEGTGFTQVNPLQNGNLQKLVREWALDLPHDHIVELFCGSGNFTGELMAIARHVTAVDSDQTAVSSARALFGASAQFFCTDAVRFWSQYKPDTPVDLLVLDPPRDGAAGMVEGVIKHRPQNILYISCNPATLARDLKYLSDFAGYRLIQTQPLDMFPMSYHIESVSWVGGRARDRT